MYSVQSFTAGLGIALGFPSAVYLGLATALAPLWRRGESTARSWLGIRPRTLPSAIQAT
ncbi:hypothetical protein [Pyrobaculum aerophilum]|uniref:hypothetical protein n=1 Tax=Pyrobaculum aerophilum TaxID=13773 RepID=UPI0015F26CBD|nr:hypothetical protein [Pyrobaculum aerophilum]MCX8137549.1 hypothetical protein [Pyrobaculum aerophilum]